MLKLKRMLKLLNCGHSLNFRCSELHMSKRTVHNYKHLVSQTDLSYDGLLRLSDFDIAAILNPHPLSPKRTDVKAHRTFS